MSKDRHWLVYTHGGGRLGNQVLRWAHWLAWANDYGEEVGVVNTTFWPYAALFAGSAEHPGCMTPGSLRVLDVLARARAGAPAWLVEKTEWRVQHAVHALGLCVPGMQRVGRRVQHADDVIDLDGDAFFRRVSSHRVTTCAGWRIAGWERVGRRQEELRAYFQPAGEHALRARDFIEIQRARFGRLVGVLIRQGDYMTWREGRFGYPTEDYVEWMKQVLELEGGGLGFVIASDTVQDPARFAGLPHVFSTGSANAGGPVIASFAELAGCDMVMGPPSTFSAMAAFAGGKPLWPVYARGQVMDRGQILYNALLDAARDPVYSLVVK